MSLRKVSAAPFLRRGTGEVTRAEFIYSLTGDLGWFEPGEAEDVLGAGVEEGLLNEDGEELRPSFDVGDVEIDGFEPSSDLVDDGGRGVFERAVDRLVDTGYGRREAVAEINRIHADMDGARVEAAALVTARKEGVRVADLAEEALDEIS
ncbi:MAG: hypothetical protein ACI9QA_000886 [Methanobacteriota archaeon]